MPTLRNKATGIDYNFTEEGAKTVLDNVILKDTFEVVQEVQPISKEELPLLGVETGTKSVKNTGK